MCLMVCGITLGRIFDAIYIMDMGGNAVKNPKLSGTTHNVFGIPRGVSVNLFIRREERCRPAQIWYARMDEYWNRFQKCEYLDDNSWHSVRWERLTPDAGNTWLTEGLRSDFAKFAPIGTRISKAQRRDVRESIFGEYSLGVSTNRDRYVYNFTVENLEKNVRKLAEDYSAEADRWERRGQPEDIDSFVDNTTIKWSHFLKRKLTQNVSGSMHSSFIVRSQYRPFTTMFLHFDETFVDAPGLQRQFFPKELDNRAIFVSDKGYRAPFSALVISRLGDLHLCASEDGFQCFPFYTYAEDGTNRRENITDWALEQFRSHYADPSITKWDIFHYVYAVLHHPEYRERYAANLRRELPRIPFVSATTSSVILSGVSASPSEADTESKDPMPADAQHRRVEAFSAQLSDNVHGENALTGSVNAHANTGSFDFVKGLASESLHSAQDDKVESVHKTPTDRDIFHAFVRAGRRLAEIHVNYEQQPEYPLIKKEKEGEKLDYRVEKMRLSKDKTTLTYNNFLALSGIPPETYEYRLGNRSALEWVIDQYQISTDKRSGITNDPNRPGDPTYILRLIGQVITVGLETVQIVRLLPSLGLPESSSTVSAT